MWVNKWYAEYRTFYLLLSRDQSLWPRGQKQLLPRRQKHIQIFQGMSMWQRNSHYQKSELPTATSASVPFIRASYVILSQQLVLTSHEGHPKRTALIWSSGVTISGMLEPACSDWGMRCLAVITFRIFCSRMSLSHYEWEAQPPSVLY